MANPNVRRVSKVCQHCQQRYRPIQRWAVSRYCSRSCSHAARTRLSRVLAGRKGGQAKAARANQPEMVANRRRSDYRRGFSDGYEQALRDRDPAYAKACDLVSRGRMTQAREVA